MMWCDVMRARQRENKTKKKMRKNEWKNKAIYDLNFEMCVLIERKVISLSSVLHLILNHGI